MTTIEAPTGSRWYAGGALGVVVGHPPRDGEPAVELKLTRSKKGRTFPRITRLLTKAGVPTEGGDPR